MPNEAQVKSSIKSVNFELTNLTPGSLVTFFEIDLSSLLEDKGITLAGQAAEIGFGRSLKDGVMRFHNNIKIFNSYIKWNKNTYYPAPINAEGFESTSTGTLPTPTLSIASQSETGSDQLALLRHEIAKFGDIIGAKVTRRRTFAKYIDAANFSVKGASKLKQGERAFQIPDGYEPDPYAELPKEIYYIERKEVENKSIIKYTLSSILDLEGIKLPKRTIISDKCVWQYRGIGCWYQHATENEIDSGKIPLLEKAELTKLPEAQPRSSNGLPRNAPPVANDKDETITSLLGGVNLKTGLTHRELGDGAKWSPDMIYFKGNYVYLEKEKIKYYFVCKKNMADKEKGPSFMPPNTNYWIADECSKSLTGCRMRWGTEGKVQDRGCGIKKGNLPFGGFPAARKVHRQR